MASVGEQILPSHKTSQDGPPPERPPTPIELKHLRLALEESQKTYQEELKRRSLQSQLSKDSFKRSSSSDALCSPSVSSRDSQTSAHNADTNSSDAESRDLIQFHDPEHKIQEEKVEKIKSLLKSVGARKDESSTPSPLAVTSSALCQGVKLHEPLARNTSTPSFGWQPFSSDPCSSFEMANSFMSAPVTRPPIGFNVPGVTVAPPYPAITQMPQPPSGYWKELLDVHTEEVGVKWRRPSETVIPVNAFLQIPFRQSVWKCNGDLIDLGPWRLDQNDEERTKLEDHRVTVCGPEELFREFDPLAIKHQREANDGDEPAGPTVPKTQSVPASRPAPLSLVNRFADELQERKKKDRSFLETGVRSSMVVSSDMLKLVNRTSELQTQLYDLRLNVQRLNESLDLPQWTQVMISPRVAYPAPPVDSVKLVVHNELRIPKKDQDDVISFTCDLSSTVVQILGSVLYSLISAQNLQLEKYGLKVFGLEEYLLPDSILGSYAYVHNCMAFGKDIRLELGEMPDVVARNLSVDLSVPSSSKYCPCVKKENLELLVETLKSEMGKLSGTVQTAGSSQGGNVVQAAKAMCTLLSKVEPVEFHQAVKNYENLCYAISEEKTTHASIRRLRGDADFVASASFRPSVEHSSKLKGAGSRLLANVHSLLNVYCDSSSAEYTPVPLAEGSATVDKRDISSLEDMTLIRLHSVHSLAADWNTNFDKFYVDCGLFHGCNELCPGIRTESRLIERNFTEYVHFDQWVQFELPLCILPREAILSFALYGCKLETSPDSSSGSPPAVIDSLLGWCGLSIFDSKNLMRQGMFALPLCANSQVQLWGPRTYLTDRTGSSILISLPKFGFHVAFPDVISQELSRISREFDSLDIEMQDVLLGILETGNMRELSTDEKEILWEKRHYLKGFPEALSLVLRAAVGWDWACLSNIYQLFYEWSPLSPVQAMELLLPEFPDKVVREKAVEWICEAPMDDLLNYLPQLVEALRFELFEDSALSSSLLNLSVHSRRLSFEFYWQLEQRRSSESAFGIRCAILQRELFFWLPTTFEREIFHQQDLVRKLDKAANLVKSTADSNRKRTEQAAMATLDADLLTSHVRVPLCPSFVASGVAIKECSYYKSLTVPLKVQLKGVNSKYGVLHKLGDDLRQDSLVLQMMKLMNEIWLQEGLDLRMVIFKCFPTGMRKGMVELVPDCKTLREIQMEEGGVIGVFKDELIRKWLQKQNQSEFDFKIAVHNFRKSCAGWCVGTFVLGIGDRHNDNILITSRGHVLHIDFGKYLGDWQTVGGVKRDRVPFVLTSDMACVINEGKAEQTVYFQEFVDMCCQSFNLLRKHHALFVNLLKLMVCSDIPGLTTEAVKYIEGNLWLDCSEAEATARFTRLIEVSLSSVFSKLNFFGHSFAQMIAGTQNTGDPSRLSFVPQMYNAKIDGKLDMVQVVECQKWHVPEKIYMYKMCVQRVKETVPVFIYRSYKEFVEFYLKLSQMHPLAKLHSLPRGQSIGRSNIREVADRRQIEIAMFLRSLFDLRDDIAHCDLVYTFFHPILRDHQEDASGQIARKEQSQESVGKITGDVKLSLEYKRGRLEILVSHARNLAHLHGGVAPDPYVKCYLMPAPRRVGKRKTRIIKKNRNPTFNEMLFYQLSADEVRRMSLQVSVWHADTLKENYCLGGFLIELHKVLESKNKLSGWFKLENIHR